jgi:hypothetical protein
MRRARYLIAAAALAGLGACGETKVDVDRLEREVAADIEEQTGTRGVEVDCPDEVEQRKGNDFECQATAPGGIRQPVEMTQPGDDGDVDWKLERP